ncbi:MAG: glycerate kinase, partial [Chitinophagaceae bacterium]
GKVDFQTLQGKVVGALAQLGKENKVAVGVITGTTDLNIRQWNQSGINELVALTNMGYSPEYCMQHAAQLVTDAVQLLLQKVNLHQ